MLYIGIDVAKDKHDCFILNHEGEVKADVFTIANNAEGFEQLRQTIQASLTSEPAMHATPSAVRVGLEATGHYSQNILNYLMQQKYPTYLINPLHTTLYRKSLSLRKAKTDRIDARTIAAMQLRPTQGSRDPRSCQTLHRIQLTRQVHGAAPHDPSDRRTGPGDRRH